MPDASGPKSKTLNKSDYAGSARSLRLPGQVPKRTVPPTQRSPIDPEVERMLTTRPPPWSEDRFFAVPVTSLPDVTKGLGLSPTKETILQGRVGEAVRSAQNIAELKKNLMGQFLTEAEHPQMRRELLTRAAKLWGYQMRKSETFYIPLEKAGPLKSLWQIKKEAKAKAGGPPKKAKKATGTGKRGRKPMAPGTIRTRKDGSRWQKQGDGSWKQVAGGKKEGTSIGHKQALVVTEKKNDKKTKRARPKEVIAGRTAKDDGGVTGVLESTRRGSSKNRQIHEAKGKAEGPAEVEAMGADTIVDVLEETAHTDTDIIYGTFDPTEKPYTPPEKEVLGLHEDLLPDIPQHTQEKAEAVRKFVNPQPPNRTALKDHQVDGVARILDAWEKGDGILLQDEAGAGKSLSALGSIKANGGKRNLIVVPEGGKDNLRAQWMRAGKFLGMDIKDGSNGDLTGEGTWIISYGDMYRTEYEEYIGKRGKNRGKAMKKAVHYLRDEFKGEKFDAMSFDECHSMKNRGKVYGEIGKQLQEYSDKVLYMSATPYTNLADMHYLTRLGMFRTNDQFLQWAEDSGAEVEGNVVKNPSTMLPMVAVAATLHVDGKALKRVTSLEGVTSNFGNVTEESLRPEAQKTLADIKDIFDAASDMGVHASTLRGAWLGAMRQFWEQEKAPQAIAAAKKALAEGKQVSLFSEFKSTDYNFVRMLPKEFDRLARNAADVEDVAGYAFYSEQAAKLHGMVNNLPQVPDITKVLVDALGGPDKVAEIHGNTKKPAAEQQARYQSGDLRVCVATMSKGGTGISLHDTVGDRPRVQINLTLPWDGTRFTQVAGRSHRLGSKSATEMVWLVGDNDAERYVASKVAMRLQSMGSLTAGDPEFNGDASTLANWDGSTGTTNDSDFLDAEEASTELTKEEKAERAENRAAVAARKHFREMAERRKAGGNVIKEEREKREENARKKVVLEGRRAAEKIRLEHGYDFKYDPDLHMMVGSAWDIAGVHAKHFKGGRGDKKVQARHSFGQLHIPPNQMPELAKRLGAQHQAVDMAKVNQRVLAEKKAAEEKAKKLQEQKEALKKRNEETQRKAAEVRGIKEKIRSLNITPEPVLAIDVHARTTASLKARLPNATSDRERVATTGLIYAMEHLANGGSMEDATKAHNTYVTDQGHPDYASEDKVKNMAESFVHSARESAKDRAKTERSLEVSLLSTEHDPKLVNQAFNEVKLEESSEAAVIAKAEAAPPPPATNLEHYETQAALLRKDKWGNPVRLEKFRGRARYIGNDEPVYGFRNFFNHKDKLKNADNVKTEWNRDNKLWLVRESDLDNAMRALGLDPVVKSMLVFTPEMILEKAFPPGTIRTHGKRQMQKQTDGKWRPVKGGKKKGGVTKTKQPRQKKPVTLYTRAEAEAKVKGELLPALNKMLAKVGVSPVKDFSHGSLMQASQATQKAYQGSNHSQPSWELASPIQKVIADAGRAYNAAKGDVPGKSAHTFEKKFNTAMRSAMSTQPQPLVKGMYGLDGTPVGGNYYRRTTDPKTKRHKYYKTQKEYETDHPPHVDGKEARKKFLSDHIHKTVKDSKKKGVPIKDFHRLAKKFGTKDVHDACVGHCKSGAMTYKNKRFTAVSTGAKDTTVKKSSPGKLISVPKLRAKYQKSHRPKMVITKRRGLV